MRRGDVSPNDGGCWFCHTDDLPMLLTHEWDAYFHLQCLLDALEENPHHPEGEFIAREFGLRGYEEGAPHWEREE